MKKNDKYKIEETDRGKRIILEKGCIIDYDELLVELVPSLLIQNKFVSVDYSNKKYAIPNEDSATIRAGREIVIEIKAVITNDKQKNRQPKIIKKC